MTVARRVFVSMPADGWLSASQNELKWGIVEKIEQLSYTPEVFTNPRGKPGLSAGKAWSPTEVDKVMRHCVGIAIIGLPRWSWHTTQGQINLPTEYCHYEGAVAYTLGLPMLVVAQEDVLRRVVFDMSYGPYISLFPPDADRTWLDDDDFRVSFEYWKNELDKRRDVFLGYCSSSAGTAHNLKRFLEKDIGARVLDWQNFAPGRTILQQIEEAAARCSAGIFLFTNDDNITNGGATDKAIPRDNVVFEAGYFINAKGKNRVLIVRQLNTKLPADLGGDIYVSLTDKSNIEPVEEPIRRFIAEL